MELLLESGPAPFTYANGVPKPDIRDTGIDLTYLLPNQSLSLSLECLDPLARPITAADNLENKLKFKGRSSGTKIEGPGHAHSK